jgi:hypothetical protein
MLRPRRACEPAKQAHSLSGAHGTHVTVSLADDGSSVVTLGGQWLGCLEVARMVFHWYDLFRHRPTPSRTPPRSGKASAPNTPSATR